LAQVLLIISVNNDSLTIPSALLQIGGLFFCQYLPIVDVERAKMAEPVNSCWWIIISHYMITSVNFSLASADDEQLCLFPWNNPNTFSRWDWPEGVDYQSMAFHD
jgi:hypothetical protein